MRIELNRIDRQKGGLGLWGVVPRAPKEASDADEPAKLPANFIPGTVKETASETVVSLESLRPPPPSAAGKKRIMFFSLWTLTNLYLQHNRWRLRIQPLLSKRTSLLKAS